MNLNNYDVWFDYFCLMESELDLDFVREVYERVIVNVLFVEDK